MVAAGEIEAFTGMMTRAKLQISSAIVDRFSGRIPDGPLTGDATKVDHPESLN